MRRRERPASHQQRDEERCQTAEERVRDVVRERDAREANLGRERTHEQRRDHADDADAEARDGVERVEVRRALAEAEIASEIYSTAGDYDLLVKFYVDNDTDIGHFINEKVQIIPGIQDTHTIIAFKAFGSQ